MESHQNLTDKKEVLRFLKKMGVDTRFVSVMTSQILINNLRFSKFSRKREEVFKKYYPDLEIVRSTVFQKICTRASRVLGETLTPREKILISNNNNIYNKTLSYILEPYTRKYGIEIIKRKFDLDNLKSLEDDFTTVALPLTLDDEVENILGHIFRGEKVGMKSSHHKQGEFKIIYPLINVPLEWICSWLQVDECPMDERNELAHDFLIYLEEVVPQVRENILKSAHYLVDE